MLIVPIELKNSAVHGLGVFAETLIKKGDIIAKFSAEIDLIIPFEQWQIITGPLKAHLEMYSYFDRSINENGYIFSTDFSKHINHSETPNMSARGMVHRALRDIALGEELMCDYRDFDWDAQYGEPNYISTSALAKAAHQ